jgi:hypothetical protein
MESESTVSREFEPLIAIKDHYPKYVVTMDELWKESIEGQNTSILQIFS